MQNSSQTLSNSLSNQEARRIALSAQGFAQSRNGSKPTLHDLRSVVDHVGLIQIDTVNVLSRAHYVPFYSRLGPYDNHLVDDLAYEHRELYEYWGHAATFVPMKLYPVLKHRMATQRRAKWLQRIEDEHPGFTDQVFAEVKERGPISVSDLEDSGGRTGPWWGLSKGKMALEWHFDRGAIAVHSRKNFTRYYDVPESFIPEKHLNAPALTEEEANRELLLLSAKHHGIGTGPDLADYYRIKMPKARPILAELAASGELEMVTVEGWDEPAYKLPETDVPKEHIGAHALVSPFDSLIWFRDRTERMFGMRYRIEIYVPEKQRQYGYYVFPFLMDEELVARVDLKADRQNGRLLVQSAHLEDAKNPAAVSAALADELATMAHWLGLNRVVVGRKGDLVSDLRKAMKAVQV